MDRAPQDERSPPVRHAELHPIRFSAVLSGIERPEREHFRFRPNTGCLIRGAVRALFNAPEALVAASELVNGTTFGQNVNLREVTYIHLMLANHHVLWANSMELKASIPPTPALHC